MARIRVEQIFDHLGSKLRGAIDETLKALAVIMLGALSPTHGGIMVPTNAGIIAKAYRGLR